MKMMLTQVRKTINKEKIYVYMLSFILLLQAWLLFAKNTPSLHKRYGQQQASELTQEAEKDESELFSPSPIDGKILMERLLEEKRHIFILLNVFGYAVLLVLGLGLFLDIRILMDKAKKRGIFQASGQHLPASWTIADIFRIIIIFVFLEYILNIFEMGLFTLTGTAVKKKGWLSLINTGILDFTAFGLVVYFVKVKYRQSLAAVGLKIRDFAKNIFLAIRGYIAFLPLMVLLLILLVILAALFKYHPPEHALFKIFFQEKNLWLLIYSTLMVVIFGPIVEEVFFRGFAYNALKNRWGRSIAAILTAVVFAALHGTIFGFLPIMALGLLLVYMYEKTGSLVASIAIHIFHNSLMVLFLFFGRYLKDLAESM